MLKQIIFFIVIFFPSTVVLANIENDWLMVPGKRAGFIDKKTTLQQLELQFGNYEWIKSEMWYGDANVPVSRLYADRDDELLLLWKDKNYQQIDRACVRKKGSRWQTHEGIRPGIAIETLEKIVSHTISFYNLGWDYGGTVLNEESGLPNGLIIRFGPEDGMEYKPEWGKKVLNTSDRSLIDLGFMAYEVCVYLND